MSRASTRKQAKRAAHAARTDNRRPAGAELLSDIRAKARAERKKARRAARKGTAASGGGA